MPPGGGVAGPSQPTLKPPTSAEETFRKLQQQRTHGRASWWTMFQPKLAAANDGSQQAVLECLKCGAQLASSNPTVTCGGHYNMHEKQEAKLAVDVASAPQDGHSLARAWCTCHPHWGPVSPGVHMCYWSYVSCTSAAKRTDRHPFRQLREMQAVA